MNKEVTTNDYQGMEGVKGYGECQQKVKVQVMYEKK